MSSKKNAATEEAMAAIEETVAVVTTANVEKTYKLSSLQKYSRKLFGVSTATFVGATSGIEDKSYTVSEIKSIIEKWCKKEVK